MDLTAQRSSQRGQTPALPLPSPTRPVSAASDPTGGGLLPPYGSGDPGPREQRLEAECAELRREVEELQLSRARLQRARGDLTAALEATRDELARTKHQLAAALDSSLQTLQRPTVPLEQYQQLLVVAERYAAQLRAAGIRPHGAAGDEEAFATSHSSGGVSRSSTAGSPAANGRLLSVGESPAGAPRTDSQAAASQRRHSPCRASRADPSPAQAPPSVASAAAGRAPPTPEVSPQVPSDSVPEKIQTPMPVAELVCPTLGSADPAGFGDGGAEALRVPAPPQQLQWWKGRWRPGAARRRPVRKVEPRVLRTYTPAVLQGGAPGRQSAAPVRVPVGLPAPTVQGAWEALLDEGRLFKLQQSASGPDGDSVLLFYNGTRDTHFSVTYHFGPQSQLRPGGRHVAVDETGLIFSCSVDPGETRSFVQGRINGYRMTVKYGPPEPEQLQSLARQYDGQVTQQLAQIKAAAKERDVDLKSDADVIVLCCSLGIQFVDWRFPPRQTTLSRPWEGPAAVWPWMRPRDYLTHEAGAAAGPLRGGGPPGSTGDAVQPNDLNPGSIGEAWLASALAVAAEHPLLIRRMFLPVTEGQRMCGAASLRICKHGWWQTVVVDNYLPSCGRMPACAFSVQDPGELWVALLQKAYAKVHGSYSAVSKGDFLEALQDLTGFPGERLSWEDPDLFNRLERLTDPAYGSHDYLVALATPWSPEGAPESTAAAELPSGQAFAVLEARRCRLRQPADGGGASVRMLRLRDALSPDGRARWAGRWSSRDSAWADHPEVTKELAPQAADADASFWIEWDDARAVFAAGGGCCLVSPGWQDVRVATEFRGGAPVHLLEVWPHAGSECHIGLHQRDRRGLEDSDPDRNYAAYAVAVLAPQAGGGWAVPADGASNSGSFWKGRDVYLHFSFEVPAQRRPHFVVWRCLDPGLSKQVVVSLHAGRAFATLVLKRPDEVMCAALAHGRLPPDFDYGALPVAPARVQVNTRDDVTDEIRLEPTAGGDSVSMTTRTGEPATAAVF